MWIQKPGWISHLSEDGEELPILTLDIDPFRLRLITGSLDNTICVWQCFSLLDGGKDPPLLSVLTEHQGPVNCLRWSPVGACFASASDDCSVLIWDFRGKSKKTLGSDQLSEDWRAIMLLRGHNADVKEVAWSSDGALLASGSIDNKILIWDVAHGGSVPLQCLEGHTGQVTGLAFDPVSRFLVSLAEDSAMIVWSLADWSVVRKVEEVYRRSNSQPLKRLSVSPDGLYVLAPGPRKSTFKYMAAAYVRDQWEVDICLVGHLQTLSVVKCSPVMYSPKTGPPTWCVAVGSYDCGLSIWRMGDQEPLVVSDVFEAAVADIAWSPDGKMLVACSSDGSIATLYLGEEPGIAMGKSETLEYLGKIHGEFPVAGESRIPCPWESSAETPTTVISAQQEVRTESGKRRIHPSILGPSQIPLVPRPTDSEKPAKTVPVTMETDPVACVSIPAMLQIDDEIPFVADSVKVMQCSGNCVVPGLTPYTADSDMGGSDSVPAGQSGGELVLLGCPLGRRVFELLYCCWTKNAARGVHR